MDAGTRALSMLLAMTDRSCAPALPMADEARKKAVAAILDKANTQSGRERASALLELSMAVLKEEM